MNIAIQAQDVLNFWFVQHGAAVWFSKNIDFDQLIAEKFSGLHQQACAAELADWRRDAAGRLAEIIVLDQFSRNLYRDSAQQFAADGMALVLAQEAIAAGHDQALVPMQRAFLYLPFMHSESLHIHQQAVQLYTQLGQAENLAFEYKHLAILQRFGRYPHRNAILGRTSSAAELEFLQQPDSHF